MLARIGAQSAFVDVDLAAGTRVAVRTFAHATAIYWRRIAHGARAAWIGDTRVVEVTQKAGLATRALALERAH